MRFTDDQPVAPSGVDVELKDSELTGETDPFDFDIEAVEKAARAEGRDDVLWRIGVLRMAAKGRKFTHILQHYGPKQRVCRFLRSYQERGIAALLAKPGRPPQREVSDEIVHYLQTLKENADPQTPAAYLRAFNAWADAPVSLPTLRRYLRKAGIRFRRPKKTKSAL